jgi:toxin ParE1/3/4
MREVRYTASAKRDLRDIAEYVGQETGNAVTKALLVRIRTKVAKLSRDGLRYRERPELGVGRRAILIGPYIAFYRVVGDKVFVQRVLHGARDITEAMFEE